MGGAATIMDQLEPTSAGAQRAPQPTDAVRALQRRLQEEGLYGGTIDGIMGEETKAAKKQLDQIEERRSKQRERDQALELERARNETERARIQQQQQETERLRLEGQQADELVRQGTERLNAMKPGFMEQYGTPLGYLTGLVLGTGGRWGLGRFMAREQRETATRANALSRQMATGQADDVPARVARVNQFWSEGAPGTPAPFGFQSARQPFPWATNPNAAPPDQLYAPPTGLAGAIRNYGPSSPGAILSGAEMGYGGINYINAHRELQAAEEALSQPKGATPANAQRVEAARQAVADANFMLRMGMGTAGGTILGQLESNFTRSRSRPSALEADAERGRLDAILNPTNPPPQPLQRVPKGQPGAGRFLPRR
jgi:lysozyme family protein